MTLPQRWLESRLAEAEPLVTRYKAKAPTSAMATVSSVVATGRRMKGQKYSRLLRFGRGAGARMPVRESLSETVKKDVDNRSGIKR